MPSFARRAGIAFLYTLIDPLSYAVPGTHICLRGAGHAYLPFLRGAGHAYLPLSYAVPGTHICRARIFAGHAYFQQSVPFSLWARIFNAVPGTHIYLFVPFSP